MVHGLEVVAVVHIGPLLVVAFQVVVGLLNSADACHSHALFPLLDLDHATSPQVINVLSCPTSVVEVPQVVGGFVVPPNKNGQDWGSQLFLVVLGKLAQLLVLRRTLECFQIALVPEALQR